MKHSLQNMPNYKMLQMLQEVQIEGFPTGEVGMVVSLSEDVAAPYIEAGQLELMDEQPAQPVNSTEGQPHAKVGDACEVDGKAGTVQEVDGGLVCVPTPPTAPVETPKPSADTTAPEKPEKPWAGGHTV